MFTVYAKSGIFYEGFVEGVGYAWIERKAILRAVSTKENKVASYKVQQLNTSEDMITRSNKTQIEQVVVADPPPPFLYSIGISFSFGTGFGLGINGSISYDNGINMLAIGAALTYHIDHYAFKHPDRNISGLEARYSVMAGLGGKDFRVSAGTNIWKGLGGMSKFKQQTGVLGINSGKFGLLYENDGGSPFSFLENIWSDGNDSYRTAALQLYYENFNMGFNIATGQRQKSSYKEKKGADEGTMELYRHNVADKSFFSKIPTGLIKDGINYPLGLVEEKGYSYRFGGAYLGYKDVRIGINSERYISHPIQAIFAHYFLSPQPAFSVIDTKSITPYVHLKSQNQFQTYFNTQMRFTLW